MPPLRERKYDIPLLVDRFLKDFARENEKNVTGIEARARAALYKYDWPGNIRQLRNCMESAVVMCSRREIALDDLPPTISQSGQEASVAIPLGIPLEEAERTLILQNLAANKGNKTKTADILGIERKTLHRKLAKYGMEDEYAPSAL